MRAETAPNHPMVAIFCFDHLDNPLLEEMIPLWT